MVREFVAARPLQALKLVLAIGTIVVGAADFVWRYSPLDGMLPFVLFPLVGMLFFVVVVGESLYRLARWLASNTSPAAVVSARPGYALVRAFEVVGVVVGPVIIVGAFGILDPSSAPGAIGMAMIVGAAGVLIIGAVITRGVIELYLNQREYTVERS